MISRSLSLCLPGFIVHPRGSLSQCRAKRALCCALPEADNPHLSLGWIPEVAFKVKTIVLALFHWRKVKKDTVNFGTIVGLDLKKNLHLISHS